MRSILTIRGKTSEWSVHADLSAEQVRCMREDGIEIDEAMHSIPEWAVACGLLVPWCFVQDVWNFRWPFNR